MSAVLTMPEIGYAPAKKALSTRAMWMILVAVIIADALDLMDSTLTTIAAPTIARDLGGGETLMKWLGSAYSLALGVLLVLGGRLGDKYGHRRTFLVGMAGFVAASLACGLAPNEATIIIGRLLQGGFGALLIPQGLAIMTSTFPRDMMGKAFSFFGPLMGIASVGGPIVGAFIIDSNILGLGWRPMFLINIVLGGAGLVLAWKVLPEIETDSSLRLDGLGAGLLAGAMFCLLYGMINGSTDGWSAVPLALIGCGIAFMVAFGFRQKTAANPLIEPTLFANRGFTAGLLLALGFFSVVTGFCYVASLFLQQGLGRTPVQTAIQGVLPMTIGIIVSSFVAAPLMARLGRYLILAGLIVTSIGGIILWITIDAASLSLGAWNLLLPMGIIGLGMGICFGSLFDFAIGDVNPSEAGSASGALSAVQQLSGAIGSAIIASIWFHRLGSGAPAALSSCLAVVIVISLACCGLVWLLPTRAAAGGAH